MNVGDNGTYKSCATAMEIIEAMAEVIDEKLQSELPLAYNI